MMIESNPFNSPEFRKQLLEKEGINIDNNSNDIELIDSEEDGGDEFDIKSMIKSAPQMPSSAKNLVMDESQSYIHQRYLRVYDQFFYYIFYPDSFWHWTGHYHQKDYLILVNFQAQTVS